MTYSNKKEKYIFTIKCKMIVINRYSIYLKLVQSKYAYDNLLIWNELTVISHCWAQKFIGVGIKTLKYLENTIDSLLNLF